MPKRTMKAHHHFKRVVRELGNKRYISIPPSVPVEIGTQYDVIISEYSFQTILGKLGFVPGIIDGEGATLYGHPQTHKQIWLGKDGQIGYESEDKMIREALK